MWAWLESDPKANTWGFLFRVIAKALVLFGLCNLFYMMTNPLNTLAGWSLYNHGLTGRERLPYSEEPSVDRNMSLFNVRAMVASHTVAAPSNDEAFRAFMLGDSTIWGWGLHHDETVPAQLDVAGLVVQDGRPVRVYNLGYPTMSVLKDLMLLDTAKPYAPDVVVWWVSLQSVSRYKQTLPPLVRNNRARLMPLITDYSLAIDDGPLHIPTTWERTLVGDRRNLADVFRLQLYGVTWTATGYDHQVRPLETTPNDLAADMSWEVHTEPVPLTADDLALDVLLAGASHVEGVPLVVVNAPIFIADGDNSDKRYNLWYPRWAYDDYRDQLADTMAAHDIAYVDLWDVLPSSVFTDSPVHLNADGASQVAALLAEELDILWHDN